jgi:hypothetical protein
MNGFGVYRWKDGRYFKGTYVLDKKSGQGIYRWTDGRVYSGEWLVGKQHGVGCIFYPNNKVKKARYENGNKVEDIELSKEQEENLLREHKATLEETLMV